MAVGDGSPGVCSGGPAKCSFAGLQLRGKFLVAPRQSVLLGRPHVSGGPARCSFAGLRLRLRGKFLVAPRQSVLLTPGLLRPIWRASGARPAMSAGISSHRACYFISIGLSSSPQHISMTISSFLLIVTLTSAFQPTKKTFSKTKS
ncbi:hypothetical protein AVEN_147098-1 [Araneus ventricosus]|uniref:Uncharacterized protein n=1 Tax=Araneus ventricosus TaxID=182803 RepID=A0A4Y2J6T9_ARAVE|nr:hypothetical protein AVEN_147098-1 [Araneus ventricosus]